MIIDSHCHYLPERIASKTSFYRQGWSDFNALEDFLSRHTIEKAFLVYPTTDAHTHMGWDEACKVYNEELGTIKKKYKNKYIVAGIVPLLPTHEGLAYHLKAIQHYGFEGISVGSSFEGKFLDDAYFQEIYAFCQKNNLFVFVHPQTNNPIGFERVKDPLLMPVLEYVFDLSMSFGKLMMEGIFDKYPKARYLFSHFGGVLPFIRDRFDTVYLMLRSRGFVKELSKLPSEFLKNVYVDTSGTKSAKILQVALEVFGAEKILWGSDFPVARSQQKLFELLDGCDDLTKAKITGTNAAALLGK